MSFDSKLMIGLLRQGQTLSVLDLSKCVRVDSMGITKLITKCTELTELNLDFTQLKRYSIVILCSRLTTKIAKLSLQDLQITDFNLEKLLTRCNKIEELDLRGTCVSTEAVTYVTENLSNSLIKLAVPENFALRADLEPLKVMPKLKYLWSYIKTCSVPGHSHPEITNAHQRQMQLMFPNLIINHQEYLRIAKDFIPAIPRNCDFKGPLFKSASPNPKKKLKAYKGGI